MLIPWKQIHEIPGSDDVIAAPHHVLKTWNLTGKVWRKKSTCFGVRFLSEWFKWVIFSGCIFHAINPSQAKRSTNASQLSHLGSHFSTFSSEVPTFHQNVTYLIRKKESCQLLPLYPQHLKHRLQYFMSMFGQPYSWKSPGTKSQSNVVLPAAFYVVVG